MVNTVDRRSFLKLTGVAGMGGIAGCYTRDDTSDTLLGAGEPVEPTVAAGDITFIWAADLPAARDALDSEPAIAWTQAGNRYVFDDGATVEVVTVGDLVFKTGASSYAEAASLVDTYPTVVFTTNGNQYTFTQ